MSARDFYTQNNVLFITGGTGFVGKTLLEKILRSLPQVHKIYLLMRISSKETLQNRVDQEIFGNRLFETLKARFVNEEDFRSMIVRKIVPIAGDISLHRLGISDQDLAMIQHDTKVVVHSAAAVSFTNLLGISLDMNLHGTLRTLEVAKGMRNLASFVHISTGYVNSFMLDQRIEEKIYPHPFSVNPLQIFESLGKMSPQEMEEYERDVVLKIYPNTYVFAKSLTEHLLKIQCRSEGIPLAIVRPTIVSGTLSEPIMGWSDGIQAASAMILSAALGHFQTWCGRETTIFDMIPVDVLVKIILLSAPRAIVVRADHSPFIALAGTGTTPDPPTTQKFFGGVAQYWQSAVPVPQRRVSNDIRMEMYEPRDFDRWFQQQYATEIATIQAFDKMDEKAKSSLGKTKNKNMLALKRQLEVIYGRPAQFAFFMSNSWYLENKNARQLDQEAPRELSSDGVLEKGINWLKYIHFMNLGIHEFVLKEQVDRTMIIPYQRLIPIQKTFVPKVSKNVVGQKEDGVVARL